MKKSWKKLLCSLVLAPCMFFATACGDDPEDPSNLTTDLTIEQQQAAYATLRTVAAEVLNNDGTKDQSYILENTKTHHRVYDFSHSGLPEDLEQIALDLTAGRDKTIDSKISYVGYKANNTGYALTQTEFKGGADIESTKITQSDITKYNGQKYVNYSSDGTNKTTAYVGNDYAKTEYVADVKKISDESEYYIISEMLDIASDEQTYEEFKSLLGRWAAARMFMSCSTGSFDELYNSLEVGTDVNITYKLSIVDGQYVLTVDFDSFIEDVMTVPFEIVGNMYLKGGVDVVFSDSSVISLTLDYETGVTTRFHCRGLWGGEDGDVLGEFDYPEDSYASGTGVVKGKTSIDFGYKFDNNFFNQSLEGYVGTGENGVVENNVSNVTIYTGNDEIGVVSIKVPYGQSLKTAVMNKMNTVLHGSKYEVFEMFISEYFGELVTDATLVPSYDIDIYLTLFDTTVPEETFVTFNIVIIDKEIEFEMTCVDFEKIKDIVKSMFNLSDSDIVGIYADASMETEIADDALVEEGINVYVKVVDSWELPE